MKLADGVTITRSIGVDPAHFAYFSVKVDLAEYARSVIANSSSTTGDSTESAHPSNATDAAIASLCGAAGSGLVSRRGVPDDREAC